MGSDLTGRASTGPNLQSIPIRFPEHRSIREAFTFGSPVDYAKVDYSKIERLLAGVESEET